MSDLVRVLHVDDGAFWRVTFGVGKGNILDREMLVALDRVFAEARISPGVKAICLEGAGGNFSFGASVQEHLPEQVHGMLGDLRRLVFNILDSHVMVLAAVRGQCLGGGLEVASLCHRVFASADARLGQPEITLGVFAPLASVILPRRIGQARAEELCLTGRTLTAAEAREIGLVDELVAGDPADAAIGWAQRNLCNLSASSLRLALKAIRTSFVASFRDELPVVEAMYLDELMGTADAVEGLRAFLDKRRPVWRHA